MKDHESILKIMSRDSLITARQGEPLSEVYHRMQESKVHHVPVVDGERFIGLLSSNDFLRVHWGDRYRQGEAQADALLDTVTLRDAMQEDVRTLSPDATVREASQVLANGAFHCLPVVDKDEKLVGLLTTTDLIKYFLAQYPDE